MWFIAINSPLWLDETVSYWQISSGFSRIWDRQGLSFPGYSYILWAINALFGSREVVLRFPSVLAMTGAAYLLYRIAREFFDQQVASVVVIIFCLYPAIIFAAIDVRPYAFATLAVNFAILSLLRWTSKKSSQYAILFGVAAAAIFYFHYLFGVILVPFALYLLIVKREVWRNFAPQLGIALIAFAVGITPVVPRLLYLLRTAQSHVFSAAPSVTYLPAVFAPGYMLPLLGLAILIAAATRKLVVPDGEPATSAALCLLLGFIPIGILYGVSAQSPMHVFVERYRLVGVPGIALCWGLVLSRINSSVIRVFFAVAVFALAATIQLEQPFHGYTWKYALEAANANTAGDHAPLLLCSDLPESDHQSMPADVKSLDVGLFAPLSYYKVASPVVPLPRALNEEAKSQVTRFLAMPLISRRRFLVIAFAASHRTVEWIKDVTKDSYSWRLLGTYDGISVVEYDSR